MKNNHFTLFRASADALLFLSVLLAPWWFSAFLSVIGVVIFKNFYEAFFAGLAFDMLYGTPLRGTGGFQFFFSSAAFVTLFIAETVRKAVRR